MQIMRSGEIQSKNVSKDSYHALRTKVNVKIDLDLYKIKAPVEINYKTTKSNLRLMVDESTQMKFTAFFDTNKGMAETTCTHLNNWYQV